MSDIPSKCSDNDQSNSACPYCGCRTCYTLADERKMCRDCRKKFTPHPKSFRLPAEQKEQIAINFWGMIPAEEGARTLDLNRKTLQRYYRHLRREISFLSDYEIQDTIPERNFKKEPSATDDKSLTQFPNLSIAIVKHKLRILTAELAHNLFAGSDGQGPCAKILYKNGNSEGRFKLDNLYLRKSHNGLVIESHDADYTVIRNFWKFAVANLAHYKVINNNNILYFFKEMEFRFNTKDEDEALKFLINKLSSVSAC